MGELRTLQWDDFSGGEYGDTPPHKAAANQFTGLNVIVYRNGEIGPRPGLAAFSNTDLPQGLIKGMGFGGTPGASFWIATATNELWVYDNTGGTDWDQATGTFNATLVRVEGQEVEVGSSYLIAQGDDVYELAHVDDGSTLTQRTSWSSAATTIGDGITKFRERLWIGDGNILRYSNAADFDVASGSVTVGFGPVIRALLWMKDALLIFMADSAIWEYRGTPGTTGKDSLRRLYQGTRHPWVFFPGRALVLPNDNVWFVPVDRDYPAQWFNGFVKEEKHIKMFDGAFAGSNNENDEVRLLPVNEDDELLILFKLADPTTSNKRALIKRDNTWSKIEWGITDLTTYAASDRQERILLSDGGGASAVPDLYVYTPSLERPGFTSDTNAQPGDATTTPLAANFSLSEWWTPDGSLVRIREIIVDFTKYDTGAGVQNHFDLTVTVIAHGAEDGITTQTYAAFDEDDDLATAAGVRDRHRVIGVSGGAKRGAGFQINLAGIVGCTIRSIGVILEADDGSLFGQPLS